MIGESDAMKETVVESEPVSARGTELTEADLTIGLKNG